jgi:L-ascorbate metabolism protein UlaG (beta-lactamase superfamily)
LTTSQGELRIVPIHHGSFRLELGTLQVYVDPYKSELFSDAPKADLILVTDIHQDHYDAAAISKVQSPATQLIVPPVVAEKAAGAEILKNGESRTVAGVTLLAVPMYNLQRGPKAGALFHDKGRGNGYVLTWGGKRIYIAGDTECTQEMRALQAIDIAFVPMNLPYTMPPEEAAECVKAFRPKVVYPYHYRGSDLGVFKQALATTPEVEVRLREWYPTGS